MLAEKNIYGFYSGGYLFDKADRIAQYFACKELSAPFVFTQSAKIKFLKQACEDYNRPVIDILGRHFWDKKDVIKIRVRLYRDDTLYCDVILKFKGKEKNYCEGR